MTPPVSFQANEQGRCRIRSPRYFSNLLLNFCSIYHLSRFSENGKVSQKSNKVNETKPSFKISWNKIVGAAVLRKNGIRVGSLDPVLEFRDTQSSKIIFFLETIVLEFAPSKIGSLNKDRLGRTGTFSRAASMEGQVERVFRKIFPKRVFLFFL